MILISTSYICTDGTLVGAWIPRLHTEEHQTVRASRSKLGFTRECVVLGLAVAFTSPDNASFFLICDLFNVTEGYIYISLSNWKKISDIQDETNYECGFIVA